ncbi:MAG: S8 family serine peptidase [Dehalococcoidia bacterium]
MKKQKCLAIALTLMAVILVVASVHGVALARESEFAHAVLPVYNAARVHDGDAAADGTSSQTTYSVDDGYLVDRWGVTRIEAPRAWQITRGDQSIIVAVLDTGINTHNQDLADRVVAEVNFTSSPTSDDLYGHGTHMAGTIVAVAPDCRLVNVKVADDTGRSEASVLARGIVWAVDYGAKVINISLGMRASPDLEEAIDYAWRQGAVIIAAAGNQGGSEPVYPAYYASCLAVAGTNKSDSLALLSGHGYWVDVAAPGFNIYSQLPQSQYGYKTGTSAATAHVSGVAALVFSIAEDSNGNGVVNDEVRWAIENSCTPVSGDGLGNGLVNAFQAVTVSSP